ncbi:PqqD family protein [Flavobacterium sp. F-380]|uniref:PqqD family protein n=1 Tax=Flavobacterium kayseriense TaxID=2764714 RepID=A0ABR7J516_9FLAO|nr:PqqD family protein [Flavobacterium kayseriense]MBC5840531.1 PqqD family protein [Flavobacterium kayseriense]MBC5846799.1 PqqD family protein [Flavobacterium kayseriense]MBU0942791.1 PqqD family protein [Bacteroidota bacterium]
MENKKYSLNTDKVIFTPLEEEGVLYALTENKYISLNESYASILKYIDEGLTYSTILERLMVEYHVGKDECTFQLKKTIDDLIAKKYINEATV